MNSLGLPIEPFDPRMAPHRFSSPELPELSPIEKQAHEIAVRNLEMLPSQADPAASDRMNAQHIKNTEKWLEDVHSLCVDVLENTGTSTSHLATDIDAIQRKFKEIHDKIDDSTGNWKADDGSPAVLPMESGMVRLLHTVETDLKTVQEAHRFFHLYDDLEARVEHWNSLAENPLYQDGECLKANAYDSLAQYVTILRKFSTLGRVKLLSPEQQQLLNETKESLKSIRKSFANYVLPALQGNLVEAKKVYQGAVKAMERTGLLSRWRQDSAVSLIEDYGRFQHALADVRYQKQAIESACARLPRSQNKTFQALSPLFVDASVTGKSIELAQGAFLRRLNALNLEEKANFLEQLRERSSQSSSPEFEETHALLRSIEELLGKGVESDPYLQRVVGLARNAKNSFQPHAKSSELYQNMLSSEYFEFLRAYQADWAKREQELIVELEKGPSVWRQRGLGLFFLALHAGTWVQGIHRLQGQKRADEALKEQITNELVALAGKKVQRGASVLVSMLTNRYRDMRTLSDEQLQRMTKRYPDGILKVLKLFRGDVPKPPQQEVFELAKDYILRHALPSNKEQIENWFTQFTTNQGEEAPALEVMEAESGSLVLDDQIASRSSASSEAPQEERSVNLNLEAYLLSALANQDYQEAIRSIQAGANPNSKDANGVSAFDLAMKAHDSASAIKLLNLGADPNAKDRNGNSPIHTAIGLLNRALVEALLEAGADPNVKDANGNSPLYQALASEMFDIMKILIAKGADIRETKVAEKLEADFITDLKKYGSNKSLQLLKVGVNPNTKDAHGNPVLHLAIDRGKVALAIALLEAGADPNLPDAQGTPPLAVAVGAMEPKIVEAMIAKGANIHVVNTRGNTLFQQVVAGWSMSTILAFLDAGADPHTPNAEGNSPLHLAADLKTSDVLLALLALNVNIHVTNNYGFTPFHMALKAGREDNAMELLKAGADPHTPTASGNSPLHLAVGSKMGKLVKALINKGVNIHVVNQDGSTPFEKALNGDSMAIVLALLDAGADLHAPAKDGRLPSEMVAARKNWAFLELLLAKGARFKKDPNLLKEVIFGMPSSRLAAVISYLNLADHPTISSVLIRAGRASLLPSVLTKGVDIDAVDKNGMTALHWASLLHLPDVAEFLRARGANIDLPNRLGMRPADLSRGGAISAIVDEEMLKTQLQARSQQLGLANLPQEVLDKLEDKSVNRGISDSSILPTLLIPSNLSIPLDADAADLVTPLAISKGDDYGKKVKASIPQHAGALRQRLGALTGSYLDELLKQYPVSEISGFAVPVTIIQTALGAGTATPVSVTRFVPSSDDMLDTDSKGIADGEWTKLLVLDVILGNTDRHFGNLRVQTTINKNGDQVRRLIPIDHDLTLPNLDDNDYKWIYATFPFPFSDDWKAFILKIDADAIWRKYEGEAAAFDATYASYTRGKSSINDDIYLNFQARIKALQEGANRGWAQEQISNVFLDEFKYQQFFKADNNRETREERQFRVFNNIESYFTAKSQGGP